jgi:hypothetical protein
MSERILVWEHAHWETDRAKETIANLTKLIEIEGEYATKDPYPGVPYLPFTWKDIKSESVNYATHRYIETKYGRCNLKYRSEYRAHVYDGGYRPFPIAVPRTKQGWEMELPQLGYLVYDILTGVATAYTDDDEEMGDVQLQTVLETRSPEPLVKMAMKKLARKGIAVWPTKMYVVNTEHYPWPVKENHIGYGYISNKEVRVPLVGVAVDRETEQYVFAWFVGHDNNVRSLLATFASNTRGHIHTSTSFGHISAYSSGQYHRDTFSVGDRLTAAILIDTRVTEQHVNDYGYLLRFRDEAGANPAKAFLSRLKSVDPTPVWEDWDEQLFEVAMENELARRINAAGGILEAFAITKSDQWTEMVDKMLQEGEIAIPELSEEVSDGATS